MGTRISWNRFWATLLALGAAFLIYRTIWLTAHGYLAKYTWWAALLLAVLAVWLIMRHKKRESGFYFV